MEKSSILLDLDDARSGKIAEVLGNKTAKQILKSLAEGEKCGSDLSKELGIPLNTVGYNLKKLVGAGLVERSKRFFWSSRGKKMEYYKVVNKKIVIMPKQMVRGVLPALVVTGLAAIGVKLWTGARVVSGDLRDEASVVLQKAVTESDGFLGVANDAGAVAPTAVRHAAEGAANFCANTEVLSVAQSAWLWFFVGAVVSLFVYLVWNIWRKK